jgi:hypothetical protein
MDSAEDSRWGLSESGSGAKTQEASPARGAVNGYRIAHRPLAAAVPASMMPSAHLHSSSAEIGADAVLSN